MTAVWSLVRGWFGALPWSRIAALAAPVLAIALVIAVYKAGQASARAGEMQRLAEHNAEVAADFRRRVDAADAVVAAERAGAEELAADNARLKERVNAVAKGDASPGVDLAVRGLQSRTPKARSRPLPGARP